MTVRWSEKATSSAVSGLPEANLMPVADLKGIGFTVGRHRPAFGRNAIDFADILHVVADQAVIGVTGILGAGKLENFGRIQGDNVIELPRHDKGVGGRGGVSRGDGENSSQGPERTETIFSWQTSYLFGFKNTATGHAAAANAVGWHKKPEALFYTTGSPMAVKSGTVATGGLVIDNQLKT